jgi:hypothetical protein
MDETAEMKRRRHEAKVYWANMVADALRRRVMSAMDAAEGKLPIKVAELPDDFLLAPASDPRIDKKVHDMVEDLLDSVLTNLNVQSRRTLQGLRTKKVASNPVVDGTTEE